jgi:hypothetical protein
MEDCRPMSTPMITNWKKLHSSNSELVDPVIAQSVLAQSCYKHKNDNNNKYNKCNNN